MPTKQQQIDSLIEKAYLGYRYQGSNGSIASEVQGNKVKLSDDWEDITVPVSKAIKVLKNIAKSSAPGQAWSDFWDQIN